MSRERGLKVIKADPDHKIEPLDRATAKMESGDMSLEDIASAAVSEEGDAEQLLSRKRQRPDEAYDGSRALALDPSLDPALQSLTGGAAQKEGGVAREALDEDVDFLAVNERGDLMHRGSSSGIQLLHRRPHANVVQQVGGGPGPSGLSNMATLESTSPSGNNAPGTGSGRMPSFGAHGPVPLPMASPRPSHGGRNGSATPRSGSRSPDRHNHLPLTNGALAHRDHILNSLSPHGTPRIRGRALPGEAQAHSLTGDRSSSPLKFNNEQHASHLRSHLESATQLQAMPLPDEALPSQEENARLFRFYWQGFHPFWPILFKVSFPPMFQLTVQSHLI